MRKSFSSHRELTHVWAQNNQSEGKASRMFFRGGRLYSYGEHFCIARILDSGVVVFGTHTYSSSTGKHQSLARSAVSHRRAVYCVDPDASASGNRERTEYQIAQATSEAQTERRVKPATRIRSKLHARHLAEQFNEYLAALPADESANVKPFDLAKLEVSAAEQLIVRQYDQEMQALREARWEKSAEKREAIRAKARMLESEKIAEWRANIYNHTLYNLPTMLRLSKDRLHVQTSKGADIPVNHAVRLWPLIENVRAVGKPLTNRDFRLGHYTLTEIAADGSIVVGCHNISYNEIAAMAKELGLMAEERA